MLAALCVSFLLICFFKRQLFSLWSLVSPLVFFVCRGVQAWNYTAYHVVFWLTVKFFCELSKENQNEIKLNYLINFKKRLNSQFWSKNFSLPFEMTTSPKLNLKFATVSTKNWYTGVDRILCGTLFKREQVCLDDLFWNNMPGHLKKSKIILTVLVHR